ncbi:54S ribosomal protein L49, mitochondrial [[Candida] jaroonii]|uniref:54S ribosomal protein L49, mitochondrial n=1 Tax=[Candida] jaroonii TaxID=467808 RepID=A0ACA9Y3W6_9ASCO|nr:54S ribosomal protein L49, mitochondrial [[Candida] jaroonii]
MIKNAINPSLRGGFQAFRGSMMMRSMTSSVGTNNIGDIPSQTVSTQNFNLLKFDSNGSKNLYAILRIHNIPYLVTKGDKIILPTKLKGVKVGDQLDINKVTTLGSPNFTFNDNNGINKDLYNLKLNVVEITREPYYEVYRKKQRCRRLKTFPVENYQTVLTINELSLA